MDMSEGQPLDVVATERGYYEHRPNEYRFIEEGEAFTLKSHLDYSFRWMEPAKNDAKTKKLLGEAEAHQDALRAKRHAGGGASVAETLAQENAELRERLAELEKGA